MASQEIDYPELVDAALRAVARRVLQRVAAEGLPGEHHFFISIRTDHPDLGMPASLREAHPEEMTVVLQNQFWDLVVEEDAFEVSVRFGGEPARLRVPWQAIKSFVDPAAEFGLRFEASEVSERHEVEEGPVGSQQTPGEIVSLEDFKNRES